MKYDNQLQPITRYALPVYPTRNDVERTPALLRAVPRRWGAKPTVCMALMLTLTSSMASCATKSGEGDASAMVIPVFEHGDGYGSYGCDSVAPPVFLSEEEAQQVIRDEAETYGIRFDEERTVSSKRLPVTSLFRRVQEDEDAPTHKGKLTLDGYDPEYRLGYEFVSKADLLEWTGLEHPAGGLIEFYDMKDAAVRLAQAVPGTAVFYDPMTEVGFSESDWYKAYWDKNMGYAEYVSEQKELILEDLRQQVRDFLAWLAAEGVI